jgi:hypothetical protein
MKLSVDVSSKKMVAADNAFEAIQRELWELYDKGIFPNNRNSLLRRRHGRAKKHMMRAWHMHKFAYAGKDWKEK